MVVTVILGCIKLAHAHWTLRQLTRMATQEVQEEQPIHRPMTYRAHHSKRYTDDVPFGIRAIEKGVEVEGVWISRDNTPELDSKDVSPVSSIYTTASTKPFDIDIEKEVVTPEYSPPTLSYLTPALSYPAPVYRPAYQSVQSITPVELPPSRESSRDSSPEPIIPPARPRKYPPLSYAKYGCNPYLVRYSMPARTLEGLEAIHKASTSIYGEESTEGSYSSHTSSNSTGDIPSISSSAPNLFTSQPRGRTRHQSSYDLELLDQNRLSQAAEMGQLAPRGRKQGHSQSLDWNNSRPGTSPYASPQRYELSASRPKLATSTSDTGTAANPVTTTTLSFLPPAVRRTSLPDVTPFAEFCKRAPPQVVGPESVRSRSRDSALSTAATSPVDSVTSSPIIPASVGAAELRLPPPPPPPPKRTSFEKRASQVVRGHGTGFEILRPGSLNPTLPNEHATRRQSAAPVSPMDSSGRRRSESEFGRKKLQKKRRPSDVSSSSANSIASGQSRKSMFV
jgi:hypothetical protein